MEVFIILQTYFEYLFLQYKSEIYSSKILGIKSGLLLLRTPVLKIKLITDPRDGFYLEVGSINDDDWVELSLLNSYINTGNKEKLKAEEAAKVFQIEFKKIEEIFSSPSATLKLLEFRKQRSKKRFGERPPFF